MFPHRQRRCSSSCVLAELAGGHLGCPTLPWPLLWGQCGPPHPAGCTPRHRPGDLLLWACSPGSGTQERVAHAMVQRVAPVPWPVASDVSFCHISGSYVDLCDDPGLPGGHRVISLRPEPQLHHICKVPFATRSPFYRVRGLVWGQVLEPSAGHSWFRRSWL